MSDIIQTAHVLIIKSNEILLVKHGEEAGHLTGVYGIPGGRLAQNEHLTYTATRELEEETGLQVSENDLQAFPNNSYTVDIKRKNGEIRRYTMTVFVCQKLRGTLRGTGETTPEWIPISQLDKYNLLPNVKRAVKDGWDSI